MATAELDKTTQRASLLAALRTFPVPTISVRQFALLRGVSLPTAYALINSGEVAVQKDGRKVSVLVAPLLEAMGFSLTPPTGLSGESLNEAAVHSAYAPAIGEPGIDYGFDRL
ncbi:hypothetical protein [Microbacterium sp.]|uniref:hypothetical protein n=1 Tax=Microbacterium sp. TaxID=51671 RepID=UPI0039E5FB43